MFGKANFFKTLFFYFIRILFKQFRNPKSGFQRSLSNASKIHKFPSLANRHDHGWSSDNTTLIFNVEGALLKSTCLFPYFMLVAFEAGSLLRAFLLFAMYPFICLVGEELGLKVMVMVCFFGIKKDSFRVGRAVLTKFLLEDVGLEAFNEVVAKRSGAAGSRTVAVSDCFPNVMIESFLRDYLDIDCVVGRELKVVRGYFVGILEDKNKEMEVLEEIFRQEKVVGRDVICIGRFNRSFAHQFFSHCKEIYWVRRADKRSWRHLPKDKYPKSLIFHDGRLALRPTPLSTLAMLMWAPFAVNLAFLRIFVALIFPFDLSIPILAFSGLHLRASLPLQNNINSTCTTKKDKGLLYVCNHRTLLDPLYLSFALKKKFTAVTYSLSRLSEILSPIKTVRLTRHRDRDARMMDELLRQGDLVVCPEGTTCREPYLLRFSPLFAEMSDEIVPVAVNTHVNMFFGTTAGGLKCLDPVFFLMNPTPIYTVQILDKVSGLSSSTCSTSSGGGNMIGATHTEKSRFHVANYVQTRISKALEFQCTMLTRRDKYLILAGNDGIACHDAKKKALANI